MVEETPSEPAPGEPERTEVIRPDGAPLSGPRPNGAERRGPADDYAICGKIGDGGMGVVYLARDRRLGRYVAIKRLNEKALSDPVLRQRFLHEARAVAALNHAYIVHIYALGEDALGPYIVMEYVAGPMPQTEVVQPTMPDGGIPPPRGLTLEQYIAQDGPMTADEAVTMILKIARTMVYAHSCGVIHRDLKPANILLDPSYEPKLVDFGLARLVANADSPKVEDLTVPGEKLVSLGYSAPELEQDASTSDVRADIYSLGATLYFLLTGRNPRYYREQDVPTFLREVMRRSLETEREQRYRSAQDFVRALSEAASHGKTVAPTIKMTWHCKWCDAVNPVTTKYCAECGWDGSERCLECGAETFVGQQYCPSCGADRRMYEHVASIIALIDQAWEERHFERIATIAGRLHGFEPTGPTGRRFLSDAHARVEEADRRIARRNRLSTLIPNELKAENYERAKTFIEEFRGLNEDPNVYEEELREIPTLIFNRDMVRIRQHIRNRDWASARHLASGMAAQYGDMPEYRDVRRVLRNHDLRRQRLRWIWVGVAVILIYLLSLPPMARLAGGVLDGVTAVLYTPVRGFWSLPGLGHAGDVYVGLFGYGSVADCFVVETDDAEPDADPESELPEAAAAARAEYNRVLADLESSRRNARMILLTQYRQVLADIRLRQQELGNYDGVVACDRAIAEYTEHMTVAAPAEGDPENLERTKNHYRQLYVEHRLRFVQQIVTETRRYLKTQDDFRRAFTQRGDMESAGAVSREIDRVRALPQVIEAERLFAEEGGRPVTSGVTGIVAPDDAAKIRDIYVSLTAEIDVVRREADARLADLPARYVSTLNGMKEAYQRSGDFNAWEAVEIEYKRFRDDPTVTEANVVQQPEDLRRTQLAFLDELRQVYSVRDSAARTIYTDYERRLEEWKVEMTKAGNMELAAAISKGLDALRTSREYRIAFGLSETAEEGENAPAPARTEPRPQPVSAPDAQSPAPAAAPVPTAPETPAPVAEAAP